MKVQQVITSFNYGDNYLSKLQINNTQIYVLYVLFVILFSLDVVLNGDLLYISCVVFNSLASS